MEVNPAQIASDWIAYALRGPNEEPDEVHARGWALYDLAEDNPAIAWAVIKIVVSRYTETELLADSPSEAHRIVGNTAAGPLEDLLAKHGPEIIETVEAEAQRDRRMAWALGCVWQNSMSDEVWTRVQRVASNRSR